MYYYYKDNQYVGCGNESVFSDCEVRTVPPEPAPKTNDEIITELTAAVQAHLDAKAKEKNYDGILSLCTYATSTNPIFAAEGQASVEWRDAVWAKCYQVLGDVLAGTRPVPTKEELITELPAFTGW